MRKKQKMRPQKKAVALRFPPHLLSDNGREIVEETLRMDLGISEVRWTRSDFVRDLVVEEATAGVDRKAVYDLVWEVGIHDGCPDDY